MLQKGLASKFQDDLELQTQMVESIRFSLKKGGAGVEYAY